MVGKGSITAQQAARLRSTMTRYFPEAMVVGYERSVPAMPNQEKDRHVAAAAVKAGAQVIVTSNLKDFRALPEGIEAQSPDTFLCNLFDLDPDRMVDLLRKQASALRNPPRRFEELLRGLGKSVPRFAADVADHVGLPWP
ncbi:PIN domain-containing protein [Haliangium sp.]|uniref:PIN domain-containing protein n=1 Tax=Haliangium sp. TaxID=2663208 RepID=UPI003D0D604C